MAGSGQPPRTVAEVDWAGFTESVTDLICVASADGWFLYLNERWAEVLGWSLAELMSRSYLDFIHPDDRVMTDEERVVVNDGGKTFSFTNRYQHKDGHYVWIEWSSGNAKDGLVYAVARDVSDRVQRLREVESRLDGLRLTEKMSQVGYYRIDYKAHSVSWSPGVFAIHGLPPDAPAPTMEDTMNYYHPEDREEMVRIVSSAIEAGEPFRFDNMRIVRPDGSVRWVMAEGRPEIDPSTGSVDALYGILLDRTETRALRERLDRAERLAAIGTLAAGVAHEINNPLSLIRANAHSLSQNLETWSALMSGRTSKEVHELVDEIEDASRRIAGIVAGLKTSATDKTTEPHPVSLRDAVIRGAKLCRNEVHHRAEIEIEEVESPIMVTADEPKITQVVVNLLVNAAQATPDGPGQRGTVRVRFGEQGGDRAQMGWFEVQDDGEGMSPEVVARAFDPFFTTKPRTVGTGLGLSICHGIVSSFGGSIDVTSEVGRGTTLRVRLPSSDASPPPAVPTREEGSEPPAKEKARVLVIDDDELVARATARLLRRHQVEVTTDPNDALARLLGGEAFDVILCDLMMPRLSGAEVYRVLREQRPEAADRLIMMTGGAFDEPSIRFLEETKVEVIQKPIEPSVLLGRVRSKVDVH